MNALAMMDDSALLKVEQTQYKHLSTHYDAKYKVGWFIHYYPL